MKVLEYIYTMFCYVPMVVVCVYFFPKLPLFVEICLYIVCFVTASAISKINMGKEASNDDK